MWKGQGWVFKDRGRAMVLMKGARAIREQGWYMGSQGRSEHDTKDVLECTHTHKGMHAHTQTHK